MAKEKLKACPFCGAQPVHGLMKVERCQLHGEPFQRARVNCPRGHAEIIGSSLEEAKEDWNKRLADDELKEARRIALEEAAGYHDELSYRLRGSPRQEAHRRYAADIRALIPPEHHNAEGRN